MILFCRHRMMNILQCIQVHQYQEHVPAPVRQKIQLLRPEAIL